MRKRSGITLTQALIASSLGVFGIGAIIGAPSPQAKASEAEEKFVKTALPLIQKTCVSCHSGDDPSGNIDFSKIKTAKDAMANVDLMDRTLINLRNKTMPPVRSKPMPEADRQKLMLAVDELLRTECNLNDPGKVTIRRLNRFEYTNTVRDLLYLDLNPAEDFPSDDVGYGFNNIGDVLTLSPIHLDQYLTAAEKLTDAAFLSNRTANTFLDLASLGLEGAVRMDDGLIFFSVGTSTFKHNFPQPGSYSLKVMAYQSKAGPEDAKMKILVDGRLVDTFTVSATSAKPIVYELPMDVASKGVKSIGLRFENDYYQAGVGDRNLFVTSIEVVGPFGATGVAPRIQRELMPEQVPAEGIRASAKLTLGDFATRAYRRPVTSVELERILKLYDAGIKQGSRVDGIKLAVQGILTSPNFIFRTELDGKGGPGKPVDLSGYEVASRLSYFLWGSMPDPALFASAKSGALATEKGITSEVDRMMKDPKAKALADSFAMQWLELERLSTRLPDPKLYPGWSDQLREDMVTETRLFFLDIVQNNRSVIDFIDGPYTFVNQRLADHYGIKGVSGNNFQRVSLAGTPRAGLLTQGSILTVTSNPTRTSPVKRGKWVLDQILGTPPPPPPPGVDEIKPEVKNQPITIREKMEIHRENPACAVCHQKMDPIGFGLENFDGVGAWREKDNGQPVDATGNLPGNVNFEGPTELRAILKSRSDEFAKTFASKLLTYALGRGLRNADRCFVDDITEEAKKSGYTFHSFVKAIVLSDTFRKRASS